MALWRDISLMWLTCLTAIAVLPAAVILLFAVKGMSSLRKVTRKALPIAQDKAAQVGSAAELVSQKLTGPVIGVRAKVAQVKGIRKATLRRKRT